MDWKDAVSTHFLGNRAVKISPPSHVADVGIRLALEADFRRGAVAGENGDVVAEGEDLFADAGEEQRVDAAGQVGAAYAAGKKHVAAKEEALALLHKAKAAPQAASNAKKQREAVIEWAA